MSTRTPPWPQSNTEIDAAPGTAQETTELSAELLLFGAIHNYPQLPYYARHAVAEGQRYWELAVAHLIAGDLLLAVHAARQVKPANLAYSHSELAVKDEPGRVSYPR